MTPTINRAPLPKDGRATNPGAPRSPYIDGIVAAAKEKPGIDNAIQVAVSAPKSRAKPYIRRGCKVAYRRGDYDHPFTHYSGIWIYWPTAEDEQEAKAK